MKLVLKVDSVTVGRAEECGGDLSFPLQRDKFFGILKHQVRDENYVELTMGTSL